MQETTAIHDKGILARNPELEEKCDFAAPTRMENDAEMILRTDLTGRQATIFLAVQLSFFPWFMRERKSTRL